MEALFPNAAGTIKQGTIRACHIMSIQVARMITTETLRLAIRLIDGLSLPMDVPALTSDIVDKAHVAVSLILAAAADPQQIQTAHASILRLVDPATQL